MEPQFYSAAALTLVFCLGAVVGALLNSLHRAAKMEQIKAGFVRQLEQQAFGRQAVVREEAGPGAAVPRITRSEQLKQGRHARSA